MEEATVCATDERTKLWHGQKAERHAFVFCVAKISHKGVYYLFIEAELQFQSSEKMTALHSRLQQEAEKIRKWKNTTELDIKHKASS